MVENAESAAPVEKPGAGTVAAVEKPKAGAVVKPDAEVASRPPVGGKSGHFNPAPGSRRRSRRPAERRQGPFVKYVGPASHREIEPSDWASLVIVPEEGKDPFTKVVWNVKNDKMVETKFFNDDQLDYLLIDDMQPGGGHSFLEVDWVEDENGNVTLDQVVYEEDDEL